MKFNFFFAIIIIFFPLFSLLSIKNFSDYDNDLNLKFIKIPPEENIILEHGTSKYDSLSEKVRIVVWNIYKAKKRNWEKDFKKLVSESDLFLVQEVYLTDQVTSVVNDFFSFHWITATGFYYKKIPTGVSTGSNVIAQNRNYLKSFHNEPILKTPKMALITEYKIEGSKYNLLVCNVHALNFVGFSKFKNQIDQIVHHLKDHVGPLILGGDFNTWSQPRMDYLIETTDKLLLNKVSFIPVRKDTKEKDDRTFFNVDHIFTRDVIIENAYVLNYIKSSDHKPITLEVKLIF